MKLSISVPDDLWTKVATPGDSPSEIVQSALAEVARQRHPTVPMANAPDRGGLDRYRSAFESAVSGVADKIREVLDAGYRFGVLVAPGLSMTDFDLLDGPGASDQMRRMLIESWLGGRPAGDQAEDLLSESLHDRCDRCTSLLRTYWTSGEKASPESREIAEILGSPDGPAPGVRWDEGPAEYPLISDTFARAMVGALRDVRDESVRRMSGKQSTQEVL